MIVPQHNQVNRVKYRDVPFDENLIKKYQAPGNLVNSCYFQSAVRLFVCNPQLSDALSRWDAANGNFQPFASKGDIDSLNANTANKGDIVFWARFFKTLQILNSAKSNTDINTIKDNFELLYYALGKVMADGGPINQKCNEDALNLMKDKFEENCMDNGEEMCTQLKKVSRFTFNNSDNVLEYNSHSISGNFYSELDSQKEGIKYVFNDDSLSAYNVEYEEKACSDVIVINESFQPISENGMLKGRKITVKDGSNNIINVDTDQIDLKNIKEITVNGELYELAFYGVHSGGAYGGHFWFEAFNKPGKVENGIIKFDDYNNSDINNTDRQGLSIYPVFYIKKSAIQNAGGNLSFFKQGRNTAVNFSNIQQIKQKINQEIIKKEIIKLATEIESEKIAMLRKIVKEILDCNSFSEEQKKQFKQKLPKAFIDSSIKPEIVASANIDDAINSENNIFSLSHRGKIKSAYQEMKAFLTECLRSKGVAQDGVNGVGYKKINESLKDIVVLGISNERELDEKKQDLGSYKDKMFLYLSQNGINIGGNVYNIDPNISYKTPTSIITPASPGNDGGGGSYGGSFLPGGNDDSSQNKSQIPVTQNVKTSQNIIRKKKSLSNLDVKREKNNKHGKNDSDKNEGSDNNFLNTNDNGDNNKTSGRPKITIFDILLCLLIIGIFIIYSKLKKQEEFDERTKNNGGSRYNLNDVYNQHII